MAKNRNQPRKDDAVLSGQNSAAVGSVILGGLEGVKSRLASPLVEARVAALSEALNYGEAGLDLVIQGLQDESEQIKIATYLLLQQRTDLKVRQALQGFNHWQLMKCLGTLKNYSERLSCLPISPDGEKVFVGGYGRIQVWDWRTRTIQTRSLQGHSREINFFAFSSDGQTIIGGSWSDARIKAWHWHTGEILRSPIKEYSLGIISMSLCSDGQTVIVGCGKGLIKVWNWQKNQLEHILEGNLSSHEVVISPDEQTLVHGGGKTIKLWNWQTGKLLRTIEEPKGVNHLAISFKEQTVVSSYDNKIKVRNLQTGKLKLILDHLQQIHSLAISPDGHTLVSGSRQGTIKVWNLRTGELKHSLEAHSHYVDCLAFSADGQKIVSSTWGEIKVWGVE